MSSAGARAWIGGRIFTGSGYADALLEADGEVIAVGSEEAVRRDAPTGTEWERLAGRLVLPGLIDPHLHWLASVVEARGVDLRDSRNLPGFKRRLTRAAAAAPPGPLLGGGWDQERLEEGRYPTRRDLDEAVPDRSVVLYRVCHHAAVVNSAALEELGIDRGTPDPPGGRIGRDANGEPTGVLFDRALSGLERFPAELFRTAGEEAIQFLHRAASRGLTAIGAMSARAVEADTAREWAARDALPVTLRFYLRWDDRRELDRLRARPGDPAPSVVGLKLALDGSLGARTAWLNAPYSDRPGERGLALWTAEEVEAAADLAAAKKVDLALHAIGDRALGLALDVLERRGGPFRIEHASVAPPALRERLRRAGCRVVVQPRFVESDTWIPERLGPGRAPWAYPIRALLDLGVPVAGSSDAPIEPFDPWTGLRTAVERCNLTPEEAIRLYTVSAGPALGEPMRGTLAPGAPSDLLVVDAPDLSSAIQAGGPVAIVSRGGRRVAGEGAI